MDSNARRWTEELTALRGKQDSPFAPDAQIHVISVSLRDLKDSKLRDALLHVPTAFTILPMQVRQLERAGRTALRNSPQFQRLRDSLRAEPVQTAFDTGPANDDMETPERFAPIPQGSAGQAWNTQQNR